MMTATAVSAAVAPGAGVQAVPALPWFGLCVRSNYEALVSALLRGKGFDEFLPLRRMRRRWSDRVKQVESPLFPGYLFCRFDPLHRLPILTTPGVVSVVGIGKNPSPIDDREIAAIQAIVQSGLWVERWPFLQAGQRVAIEDGPLLGIEGIVLQLKNQYRLVVSVSLLQRSVAVEVDRAWIRPLGPPRPPRR